MSARLERFHVILPNKQPVWSLASVTSGTGGSRYLDVPGLVCAMYRQLVFQA